MTQPAATLYQEMITAMQPGQLSAVVSRLLAKKVTVCRWQAAPLGAIDFSIQVGSGGVYRVWGTAATSRGVPQQWSLVVKVLKSPAGCIMPNGMQISQELADDPATFGYWRREALLAQSGLLTDLPTGLAAPHYLAVVDEGETIWLWQEAMADDRPWSWADYREAAYRLGLWQGCYGRGRRPLPEEPWLAHNWLQQWVDLPLIGIMGMLGEIGGFDQPLIQAYFAAEELAQLQMLWAERQLLLDTLSALPQTWCHLDAYRSNLFWEGDNLRLIDWAFSGRGAIGEELAAFVGATLLLDHLPVQDGETLETAALDGYLAGLRAAGWPGSADKVILAYHCAMPLRYALMALASMLRTAFDPIYTQDWVIRTGKPLPELLQHRAGLIRFFLSRRQPVAQRHSLTALERQPHAEHAFLAPA